MERKIEDVTELPAIENITEFPNEILWKIFGYLSNYDVLRNVAQVSKKFHELTQDQFLISKIEVDTGSWYKGTKSEPMPLTEQEKEKYCNDLLGVCKRSRKLTFFSLTLDGWNLGPQNQPKIVKALPLMDHQFLEEFCLKSRYLDSLDENTLKYLHQCPNLKILKFEFKCGDFLCNAVRFSMISKVNNNFEHENLEELHLIGLGLDLEKSAFKKSLETIVGNFPKLQYLYLSFLYIRNSFYEYCEICEKIASEKKIKIRTYPFKK